MATAEPQPQERNPNWKSVIDYSNMKPTSKDIPVTPALNDEQLFQAVLNAGSTRVCAEYEAMLQE